MIKYAVIKGFRGMGEVLPHMYQWIQIMYNNGSKKNTPIKKKFGAIIFIRAYDTEPKAWSGYLFLDDKTYINGISTTKKIFESVENTLGKLEHVKDFKDFLKGMGENVENDFSDFKEISWEDKENMLKK